MHYPELFNQLESVRCDKDEYIFRSSFDGRKLTDEHEDKVIDRILPTLSLLMDRSFQSVRELNRYRKELSASLTAGAKAQPA